ncbi:MAG: ROK family protein [Alphaproteobacteria bacterium]|nr:ROK family protein [Alphaproteobacteria bacterium]
MAANEEPTASLLAHGAERLTHVTIDTYNAELRSAEGFIGDRASRRAFRAILDDWRERVSQYGEDPFGENSTDAISKKELDKVLVEGDIEAAGVVQGAIEEFSQEFALVIRRLLRLKHWKDTERIVVGGGLRNSRIGELTIGRTGVILKAAGHQLDLHPIKHDPDHAGLIGSVHLVPSWMFAGHDSILAADIGGTNLRAGIVELRRKKKEDLSEASVTRLECWRHADDKPSRSAAVERLVEILRDLIRRAEKGGLQLAPFVGVGCPGVIRADGTIARGGQNLPGDWEDRGFNLPRLLRDGIEKIGEHDTVVVMHNDAVIQGLSQLPFMQDVQRWGVLTIGTGLGNARFTNRSGNDKESAQDKESRKDKEARKEKEPGKESAKGKSKGKDQDET